MDSLQHLTHTSARAAGRRLSSASRPSFTRFNSSLLFSGFNVHVKKKQQQQYATDQICAISFLCAFGEFLVKAETSTGYRNRKNLEPKICDVNKKHESTSRSSRASIEKHLQQLALVTSASSNKIVCIVK